MRQTGLAPIAFVFLASWLGPIAPAEAVLSVVTEERLLVDTSRPTPPNGSFAGTVDRTLRTALWVPTGACGGGDPCAPFPLLLMAHGFGGLPESFDAFARDVAGTGYVVAAPAFPLTNADHPGEELGLFDAVEQPADLAFVAAELVAASATATDSLFGVIDGEALAVLGHSLGGSTAQALAHSDCCPVPGLRAAVLAAAFPGILSPNLVETGPPTLILHGTADATVPFALAAPLFDTLPAPRFFVGLVGAGHGPMITSQVEPPIPERAAAELATLAFLEAEFRGADAGLSAALEALRGDGHLVVVERCLPETQTCDAACTEVAHSSPPAAPPDQNPGRARLAADRLDVPGDAIVVASGLMNPAASVPAIDPMVHGIHVRLEDDGGPLVDVSIPGTQAGATPCEPGEGWSELVRSDGALTWRYRNYSNRLPPLCQPRSARGVRAVTIRDRTEDPAVEAFAFTVKLRRASMLRALVDPPVDVSLTLSLASQLERGAITEAATVGQCAHMRFVGAPIPSSPPRPFCSQRRTGGLLSGLRCKGP